MCIIAAYLDGKRPTRERVERMMTVNADGVGIGWNTGKTVAFKKGFTKADAVLDFIDRLTTAKDIVFHARIATSGGISASKCHPYPITKDNETLDKITYYGKTPVIFHNGVFSIDIENGLNDSQTFVKYCIQPIYKKDPRGFVNGDYDGIIKFATRGNRLAILTPDGVRLFGDWVEDDNGVMYSNTTYKPFTTVYYGGGFDYDNWREVFDDWDEVPHWWKVRTRKGAKRAKGART